jgi:hypothetical protein
MGCNISCLRIPDLLETSKIALNESQEHACEITPRYEKKESTLSQISHESIKKIEEKSSLMKIIASRFKIKEKYLEINEFHPKTPQLIRADKNKKKLKMRLRKVEHKKTEELEEIVDKMNIEEQLAECNEEALIIPLDIQNNEEIQDEKKVASMKVSHIKKSRKAENQVQELVEDIKKKKHRHKKRSRKPKKKVKTELVEENNSQTVKSETFEVNKSFDSTSNLYQSLQNLKSISINIVRKLITSDGQEIDGDFSLHPFNGEAKYCWPDKSCYEGQWKNNKMHGHGVMVYPDSRVYKGNFIKGFKEGFGVMSWPNGNVYEGNWKAGKQHGKGLLVIKGRESNLTIQGEWKNGMRVLQVG